MSTLRSMLVLMLVAGLPWDGRTAEAATTLRCGQYAFSLDSNGALISVEKAGKPITGTQPRSQMDAGSVQYRGATFQLAKPAESKPMGEGVRLRYALGTQPPIRVELLVEARTGQNGAAVFGRDLTLHADGRLTDDLVVRLPLWPGLSPQTWLPRFEGLEGTLGDSPAAAYLFAGAMPGKGIRLAIPMVSFPLEPAGQRVTFTTDCYFSTLFTRDSVQWKYPKQAGLESGVERRQVYTVFHEGGPQDAMAVFFDTALADVPAGPSWLHQIAMVDYDYMSDGGKGWFADIDALAAALPDRVDRGKVFMCLHGWYDWVGQYCLDRAAGKLAGQWSNFGNYDKVKSPPRKMEDLGNAGVPVDLGFGKCPPTALTLKGMHERIDYAHSRGFRVGLYFADGMNAGTGLAGFSEIRVLKMGGWIGPDTRGKSYCMNPLVGEVRQFYLDYADALLEEYGGEIDALVWDETFMVPAGSLGPEKAPGYADRAMMTLVREVARKVEGYSGAHGRQLALLTSDCDSSGRYALVAHGTYQDSWCKPSAWSVGIFPNWRNTVWSCCWWPLNHWNWVEFGVRRYQAPVAISNGWGDNAGFSEMTPEMRRKVLDLFHWRKNRPVKLNYFSVLPTYSPAGPAPAKAAR